MRQLKISQKITNRESEALEKYLTEVSRLDVLTPEEEVELAKLIKLGDQEALDKMVTSNLRFVVSVAKQYQNNGLSLNDLINEGNVGLLKAGKRFDETKGFKFITYAVWWIRQAILQAIVENSRMIRLPYNKVSLVKQINTAHQEFLQSNEREPSAEELGEILDMDAVAVESILASGGRHSSLDEPLGGDGENLALLDLLVDENQESPDLRLLDESLKNELKSAMGNLAPREREVITAIFGLDGQGSKTLEEVSRLYNMSIERIRQVREHAFRRLKRNFNRSSYKHYS